MTNSLPPAQLIRCYRSGERIYFTIGKAQDMNATIRALQSQVPNHARHIDPILREWQVDCGYEHVLTALFVNFPSVMRNQSGAYVPPIPSSYNHSGGRLINALNQAIGYLYGSLLTWSLWLLIPLMGFALWTLLNSQSINLILNLPRIEVLDNPIQVQPEVEVTQPPPTVTQIPPTSTTQVIANVTVLQTANLRAGPGTDFEVREQVSSGEELVLTGQVLPPGDTYIWFRLENGLWIYSQLVSGPATTLPTASFD